MLCIIYQIIIGLLTLTAINGLGGVNDRMDDDAEVRHEKLGCSILYFILACITFLSLLFIHYYVPETKEQTHEKMMMLYDMGNNTNNNSDYGLNGTSDNTNNNNASNANNGSNSVNKMKEYTFNRRYSNTSMTSLTNPLLARNDTETVYVI